MICSVVGNFFRERYLTDGVCISLSIIDISFTYSYIDCEGIVLILDYAPLFDKHIAYFKGDFESIGGS
jgi:hypothetical protein